MRNSNHGFSIIEVLVSMAIIGIASMIGLDLYRMSLENIKLKEVNIGMESIRQTIRQKIRYAGICTTNFSFTSAFDLPTASSAAGQPVTVKYEDDKGTVLAAGTNNIEGVNILSLNVTNLTAVDTSVVPYKYAGLIKLSAEKAQTGLGGKQFAQQLIGSIIIETDAANNFLSCYVEDSALPTTCALLGGNYNPAGTPPCTFTLSLGQCVNANEYLVGFTNGTPVCKSFDGMCPAGQHLVGISASGIVCSP